MNKNQTKILSALKKYAYNPMSPNEIASKMISPSISSLHRDLRELLELELVIDTGNGYLPSPGKISFEMHTVLQTIIDHPKTITKELANLVIAKLPIDGNKVVSLTTALRNARLIVRKELGINSYFIPTPRSQYAIQNIRQSSGSNQTSP